jgi:Tfp pilus assembly protein PilX
MKRFFKETKGAALVTVLVLCIIFAILGVAIGWVALSMNKRSVNNYTLKQDYFTSRSALETVVNQLNGFDENTTYDNSMTKWLDDTLIYGTGKAITMPDFFGTASGSTDDNIKTMGACTVTGYYRNGKIDLHAVTGTGKEGKITASLCRESSNTNWPSRYWASNLTQSTPLSVGKNTSSDDKCSGQDVAVYQVSGNVSGTLEISQNDTSEKKAIFIYVQNGATLQIDGVKTDSTAAKKNWFAGNEDDWNNSYGPDVYIFLEGTKSSPATLKFTKSNDTNNPYPLYIAGTSKDGSVVSNTTGNKIQVYYCDDGTDGTVNSGSAKISYDGRSGKGDTAPKRLPISGYAYKGTPATVSEGNADPGIMANTWTMTGGYQNEGD